MTLKRRLSKLEAALPPVVSVVDQETLRMKVRFMAELAGPPSVRVVAARISN